MKVVKNIIILALKKAEYELRQLIVSIYIKSFEREKILRKKKLKALLSHLELGTITLRDCTAVT